MSDLSYYSNSEKYPDTYLSSPLLPVALSLLVGYTVAQCFFNVSHIVMMLATFVCHLSCHPQLHVLGVLQAEPARDIL